MGKLTVLVVDDDPGNRMVAEAALSGAGINVLSAGDPDEARVHLGARRIDVLLLDVMMPGESGAQMCRELRQHPAWDTLPIVMMTALDPGRHRAQTLALGADDWIEKPLDLDDLERTVRKWAAIGRGRP